MKFDSQNYLDIEHGVRPRANFDDILSAITSVFVLIGGEDWQYVMYDGIRSTNWFSVAYFVILVIFGQIILLNLVIAVLVESFNKHSKPLAVKSEKGTFEYFAYRFWKACRVVISKLKKRLCKDKSSQLEKSVVIV